MFFFGKKEKFPKPKELQKLLPFQAFDQENLFLLSRQTELLDTKAGKKIFKRGSKDKWTYFLLSGEISLKDKQGKETLIKSGTPKSLTALSHLQPRMFTAITTSDSRIIRLNKTLLDNINPDADSRAEVNESNIKKATYQTNAFFKVIYNDLVSNRLLFPLLPLKTKPFLKAINKVKKPGELVNLIQCHPYITAKLVKAANGPLFHSLEKVSSCIGAIKRLELEPAKQICLGLLEEYPEVNNPELAQLLRAVLEKSLKVAAIARVNGKLQKGFDEDTAGLVGLLHNIGSYFVVHYADKHPELIADVTQARDAIQQLSAELSAIILRQWNFDDTIISAVAESGNWKRNTMHDADMADMLIVAEAYFTISKKKSSTADQTQHLLQIPAFKKLKMDKLSPKFSMKLLNQAGNELGHVKPFLA